MKFYMPARVYDEPECVRAHAAEIAALGKKALIVTGRRSAAACGALDDVKEALEAEGRAYVLFDEVEENPSLETVLRGAAIGQAEGADFVIGIGGGSPMDASKAIALLMCEEEPSWEVLYDTSKGTRYKPVVCVPTTCGTGAEVTGVSVLTNHQKKSKASIPHRIWASLALIDGKYLRTAPLSMIANTSVDAFAHAAESLEAKAADVYSRTPALEGLRIWSGVKDILLGEREADDEDRAKLMRASAFAGIAIAQTSTSIPHALGYALTYELNIPHGPACGYFLARYFREAPAEDRDVIFRAAGFADMDEFEAFMSRVLPARDVPAETLRHTYDAVMANEKRRAACRFKVDGDVLARIVGI